MKNKWIFALIFLFLLGCSGSNSEAVKKAAPEVWKKQGFEIVSYEGFQWGKGGFGTNYGGAYVWHRLKRIPDDGVLYSGFIQKWGDEYHVYGPNPLNVNSINVKIPSK